MKLNIKNFRAIEAASIPLDKHVFIGGTNGSGKTSVAMAIAAAATSMATPWDGVKAKDARSFLRDGEERGGVGIKIDSEHVAVNYPGGSVSGSLVGSFFATPIALGITSFATMKAADAAKTLANYIKAEPTRDDFAAVVGETVAAKLWQEIESKGWDAVLSELKEKGTRLKGHWEATTGENYGSVKAAGWRPHGSESIDLNESLESLQEKAAVAAEKANAALANKAISGEKIRELEALVKKGEEAEKWLADKELGTDPLALKETFERELEKAQEIERLKSINAQLEELSAAKEALLQKESEEKKLLAEIENNLRAMPKPSDAVVTATCPSCGTHLVVVSRSVLKLDDSESLSDEENENRAQKINSAKAELAEQQKVVDVISSQIRDLAAPIAAAMAAGDKLLSMESVHEPDIEYLRKQIKNIEDAKVHIEAVLAAANASATIESMGSNNGSTTEDELLDAKHAVELAEFAVHCKQLFDKASKIASQIKTIAGVVEVLAPSGLRQSVLAKALDAFNAELKDISETAKWKTVSITDKMSVQYGGRDYGIQLSESEKFRTRVVLQLALAKLDGSKFVVIDAADILDRNGRNGLIALIKQSSIHVITTMTFGKVEDFPSVARLGIAGYWLENGKLIQV